MQVSDLETQAWQRARKHKLIELGAAIVAGGGLVVMFLVFCSILSR